MKVLYFVAILFLLALSEGECAGKRRVKKIPVNNNRRSLTGVQGLSHLQSVEQSFGHSAYAHQQHAQLVAKHQQERLAKLNFGGAPAAAAPSAFQASPQAAPVGPHVSQSSQFLVQNHHHGLKAPVLASQEVKYAPAGKYLIQQQPLIQAAATLNQYASGNTVRLVGQNQPSTYTVPAIATSSSNEALRSQLGVNSVTASVAPVIDKPTAYAAVQGASAFAYAPGANYVTYATPGGLVGQRSLGGHVSQTTQSVQIEHQPAAVQSYQPIQSYHAVAPPQLQSYQAVAQPQLQAVAGPQYQAVSQPQVQQYQPVAQPQVQYQAVAQPQLQQYQAVAQPQVQQYQAVAQPQVQYQAVAQPQVQQYQAVAQPQVQYQAVAQPQLQAMAQPQLQQYQAVAQPQVQYGAVPQPQGQQYQAVAQPQVQYQAVAQPQVQQYQAVAQPQAQSYQVAAAAQGLAQVQSYQPQNSYRAPGLALQQQQQQQQQPVSVVPSASKVESPYYSIQQQQQQQPETSQNLFSVDANPIELQDIQVQANAITRSKPFSTNPLTQLESTLGKGESLGNAFSELTRDAQTGYAGLQIR